MKQRTLWLGGYVRPGKRGSTYVIEKWVGGVHFHVSTRCSTQRAALKQLERFEADPYDYSPLAAGSDPAGPLSITADLVEKYRQHLREAKRDTPEWVANVVRLLGHWAEDLGGQSLRRMKTAQLRDAVSARRTSRRHRIEAIKGFCAWLREDRELLGVAEDPTLALKVPQAEPAKLRRKRAVSMQCVPLVMPLLDAEAQDVLELLTGTSWHISEVRRFAARGEVVRQPGPEVLAVLVTPHKSGDLTRTPIVAPGHLAAAQRIRERGRIPRNDELARQMRAACEEVRRRQERAGVPEKERMPHWRMGVMRHSVLTHAVEQGATPEQAAAFAGHRSAETTKRFYLDIAVPTVRVPVLRLVKP